MNYLFEVISKFVDWELRVFSDPYKFSKSCTFNAVVVMVFMWITVYLWGSSKPSPGEMIFMTFVAPFVLTTPMWLVEWIEYNIDKE